MLELLGADAYLSHGGPVATLLDWHVTSGDPSEGGCVFHTLHVTHTPPSRAADENHFGIALYKNSLDGQPMGNGG